MNNRLLYILLIITLLSPALFAGWSEPVRLTYRGSEINPQVVARNDTVHVVWQQLSGAVSYIRSTDNGHTWNEIINLNALGHQGAFVDLTKNNGTLFAGWADYPNAGHANIGYSVSLDGLNWSTPSYMLGNNSNFGNPIAATMSGDSIYGVYYAYSQDSTGNIPFKFLYSSDAGQTWSNEQTVAYAMPAYCNGLIISKCFGALYIVWNAVPIPESTTYETQVVISYDGGLTWSPKTFLSQNGGRPAQLACASCSEINGFFAVGWMDYNYPGRFYIRITRNLGYTWRPEIQNVTSHYISDPNLFMIADTLWATWTDWSYADHWEIGYSKSTDQGQSWSETERISNTPGNSMTPWLSYDHGKVHLVWQEDPNPGGRDIYYRHWEPGDGIDEMPDPISTGLLESYPNPFNSTTIITYSNIEGGEIQIYDISGRLIRSLLVKEKSEGTVIWDAKDGLGQPIASGIYFAKSKTSSGFATAKLVHLK